MGKSLKYSVSVFTTFRDAIMHSDGHERLTPEKNLGPWEQVKFTIRDVEEFVACREKGSPLACSVHGVATTSDHVVNAVRLCVKRGIITPDDVTIVFHGDGAVGTQSINIDRNGSLDKYPDGFLDTWNKVLLELI